MMRFFAAAVLLCGLVTRNVLGADGNSTSSAPARIVLPRDFTPPQVFKNVNLLRSINLEKGYVREQTNLVIENIGDKPETEYYLAFATDTFGKVGGLDVWDKNDAKKEKFEVEATEYLPSSPNQFYVVHLPKPLAPSSQLTLSISYYLLSSLKPLPAAIEQDAKQYLAYTFSAYAPSAYTTENQKTKVKFPNMDVPEYTRTVGLKSGEDPERQGSTFTYGPYKSSNIAPGTVEPITVRYEFTKPIITCSLLERDIEVSHWGGNLATEDRYWLKNDGAKLAKHFSRVSWTMKSYQNLPSTAMSQLKFPLKPGSVDPYFTDDIGNVSTSRFRPGVGNREAMLELKPRYPVFGDWKYSFRIGWNNALSPFLRKSTTTSGVESYVLKVPFLEGPKMPEGVQYEKMQLRIILPEGAENVKYEIIDGSGLPTSIQSELTLYKTFMDTIGRTVLKLTSTNIADEARGSHVIVTYDYPYTAMLRKPLTIFTGMLSVFVAAWIIGNIDISIKRR
ncbi:hypothetical protein VTO42DRAFT_8641 [Malbranchea cinnamomea]